MSLYEKKEGASKYPAGVVDAFFDVMAIVESVPHEQDLYAFRSLRFEKLKGGRARRGERSLRLNDQYRLIVKIEEDSDGRFLFVIKIEDYH